MRSVSAVAVITSSVLLSSATLKIVDVSVFGAALEVWKAFAICIELVCASAAITCGRYKVVSWIFSECLFFIFVSVSTWNVIRGEDDCGCFGPIAVPPVVSLSLSSGILISLVLTHNLVASDNPTSSPIGALVRVIGPICVVVIAVWMVGLYANRNSIDAGHGEAFAGNFRPVAVLNPTQWKGKEFPLVRYIVPSIDLSNGRWILLLHRTNCPRCKRLIPEYIRIAGSLKAGTMPANVGLICIDEDDGQWDVNDDVLVANLSDERRWVVRAPIELIVDDGIVQRVTLDPLPSTGIAHE